MEIRESQLDASTLVALAAQAIELLCARDFDGLADRFPYALALGRAPAAAVATDLAQCLSQVPGLETLMAVRNAQYKVVFFEPNDIPLQASVECRFVSPSGDVLVVDLVVVGEGHMHLAVEGIMAFPADSAA